MAFGKYWKKGMIKMPTLHNKALKGEIANIVLMSGDPLRVKYIAEKIAKVNSTCPAYGGI